MAFDTTEAGGALKEFYLPAVRYQVNNKCMTLEQMERSSEHVEGEEWVLSLVVGNNEGVGARLEGGTSPTAGQSQTVKARGDVRELLGRIRITSKTIKAMATDKGSWTRAVDSQTKNTAENLRRDTNRQIFGTSNGVIATCEVGGASTTVELDPDTPASAMRQLVQRMVIDIGTVAAPTTIASARTISSVDRVNKTLVISGAAVTTTASHFIFRSGSGGAAGGVGQAELTGMQTAVAESGSYLGVDPATYEAWAATVLDGGGVDRPVTEELFEEAMDEVAIASGAEVDLFITSFGVYREYGDAMKTLKRFPGTIDLKGGHKALDITSGGGTAGLTRDRDVPDGSAFGLTTEHWFAPEMSDWDWIDLDGAILRNVANTTDWEATLQKFMDVATDERNANVLISDLAE